VLARISRDVTSGLTATASAARGHRPGMLTRARRHTSQAPLIAARVARRLQAEVRPEN